MSWAFSFQRVIDFGPATYPSLCLGVLLGLIQIRKLMELSMKSEYRQAVESVIAQEAKLAEVARMYAEVVVKEEQLSETLRLNRETLARYEARVIDIESQLSC